MTLERFAEIRDLFEHHKRSRLGKPKLWAIIGELANEVGGDLHLQNIRAANPLMMVNAQPIAAAPTAALSTTAARPSKPVTPSPGQWKRMTEDERTEHFLAVRAYDNSLTPDEQRAILDAEAAMEKQRQADFADYKKGFDADAPYVRPN